MLIAVHALPVLVSLVKIFAKVIPTKNIMSRPSTFNHQAVAICSREQAEQLANYDHQRVNVLGEAGVLLTSEWMPLEEHAGPFLLTVVFHYAQSHPPAPAEIQAIVDRLKFQVRGQPR